MAVHPAALVKYAKLIFLRFAMIARRIKTILEALPKMGRAANTSAFARRAVSPEWMA